MNVEIMEGADAALAYFISVIVFLNLIYLLSSIFKRSGVAIAVFLFYFIAEFILYYVLPDNARGYLPLELINDMIPNPVDTMMQDGVKVNLSSTTLFLCSLYIVFFIGSVYGLIRRGNAAG